jgi:hypothetical protein
MCGHLPAPSAILRFVKPPPAMGQSMAKMLFDHVPRDSELMRDFTLIQVFELAQDEDLATASRQFVDSRNQRLQALPVDQLRFG